MGFLEEMPPELSLGGGVGMSQVRKGREVFGRGRCVQGRVYRGGCAGVGVWGGCARAGVQGWVYRGGCAGVGVQGWVYRGRYACTGEHQECAEEGLGR